MISCSSLMLRLPQSIALCKSFLGTLLDLGGVQHGPTQPAAALYSQGQLWGPNHLSLGVWGWGCLRTVPTVQIRHPEGSKRVLRKERSCCCNFRKRHVFRGKFYVSLVDLAKPRRQRRLETLQLHNTSFWELNLHLQGTAARQQTQYWRRHRC